ncbi:multidrug efflux MFS transporter [Paenibacillus sp. BSR1-1]|uniref:multidrug efflux MFS transporter n=1 Tax=Paenibacillus sp. BSR1-1 TaxID=3020845 RepID=UPI0025B0685D|nr:multidrug efflux MFS transporter [Paenibacillus sp. BSR1-1]MDN3015636.1 multidrug efflux MFS transporter [Paenibacillus sp. BSR1-1]
MPIWKRNLIVCWFGMFMSSIGMSQIAPVLPLYINHLGVHNPALIAQYSGFGFGATFIISAVFSPIWGSAADKYGRKPMLMRASLGMGIVIGCMGFAHNVFELIGLRLLLGVISGYGSACTALIATQTDKEHAGFALGTLSTAGTAGSLIGPMIGGYLEETTGLQNVFFITGALLLISFIATAIFVKETFNRQDKKVLPIKKIWSQVPEKSLTITLFVTFFILTFALYSIEPIITIYITLLTKNSNHVALLAGMTFSAAGLASILAAPRLGRLSDKLGAQYVIFAALIVAGLMFIPQAFVKNPWELMGLRFMIGLASAGLMPSVNTLLKQITPDFLTGRVFGITMSAGYLGVFGGATLGGQMASYFGIRSVFLITGALLLMNAVWVFFNVLNKMNHKENPSYHS